MGGRQASGLGSNRTPFTHLQELALYRYAWNFEEMAGFMNRTTVGQPDQKEPLKNGRSSSIGTWTRLRRLSGWRKSAFVNTVLVFTIFLLLLSFHIVIWANSGSLIGYQIIHSGRCVENSATRLNSLLHLLINALSTLVLASSNFFMQVLNAPSREELDEAHEKGSWLEIGVPSLRNAFRVSHFKTIIWMFFFLTSIPIHLLFNSVIFSTDHRESDFSYFVFDESVLTSGETFDPGTSLSLPYEHFIDSDLSANYNRTTNTWLNATEFHLAREWYFQTVYPRRSRIIHETVEEILQGYWHKLDTSTCRSLYETHSCSGLRTYQDVAIILKGSSGWARSQVWDLPEDQSSFWDTYMPNDVNNSLWFAHLTGFSRWSCELVSYTPAPQEDHSSSSHCLNTCSSYMGMSDGDSDLLSYSLFKRFISQGLPLSESGSELLSHSILGEKTTMVPASPRSHFENSSLSIEYCLAKPIETICHVGLASTPLLVVSICVLLKALLCIAVIIRLGKTNSLVTPGDAIESLISQPPDYMADCCLLDQRSVQSRPHSIELLLFPGPTQWSSQRHRRWHAVPKKIWWFSYSIFSIGLALLIYFLRSAYEMTGWAGSFGQDGLNSTILFPGSFSPNFEQAVLIANSPQIFLSFAYLAYNNIFTRLQMAKEWSAMSIRHKALRVSDPKGQQSSTYFLQLPYRYSVPLIIISILLHWILSGCVYLLVTQGGYFAVEYLAANGPFSSSMAIGFSTKSLVVMIILVMALAIMPPVFGLIRLPANTVVVGSNSLAIAAACQVSPLVGQRQPKPDRYLTETSSCREDGEMELQILTVPSSRPLPGRNQDSEGWKDEEGRQATLLRISQSKIRWGVVKMPSSWSEKFVKREPAVEHISFGLPEDDVQQPIVGHWYA